MSDVDQDQKTEQPTEKKLSEAMEKGQFAKSPELSVLFVLAATVGTLTLTIPSSAQAIGEFAAIMFTQYAVTPVQLDTVTGHLGEAMSAAGGAAAPVIAGCVVAALFAGGVQSGFQLTPKAAAFRPEALNPISGFKRVFSKSVFMKALIDLMKLAAIGLALYLGAKNLLLDPLFSAPVEVAYLGEFLRTAVLAFLGRVVLALGIIAAISYAYEKYKKGRELMMTRQEVKDERKNAEGDALVKSAMRRMARRLGQKQMLEAVATADVVVTNPTHYAVALKYERGKDRAPVVLAKGENRFAQRIKAIAAEHGVPTVENKPVARMLFALGRVGETIPSELYQAVAQILAVVYRTHRYYFHLLKMRRMGQAA